MSGQCIDRKVPQWSAMKRQYNRTSSDLPISRLVANSCFSFDIRKPLRPCSSCIAQWPGGALGKAWVVGQVGTGTDVHTLQFFKGDRECRRHAKQDVQLFSVQEGVPRSLNWYGDICVPAATCNCAMADTISIHQSIPRTLRRTYVCV